MILGVNQIYGYYEEPGTGIMYLAEHGNSTSMGIYECQRVNIESLDRIQPIYVNYATQINPPHEGCAFDGSFGNIIGLENYLFVPYYKRSGNSWDIIAKYSKSDLTLIRSKTLTAKGIVQDGAFTGQELFSSYTYDGLWKPTLAIANNVLHYLIDGTVFMLNPNDLSIAGEITFGAGFEGLGIVSVLHKGSYFIGIITETQIRFFPACTPGRDLLSERIANIPKEIVMESGDSMSSSKIDSTITDPAKAAVYAKVSDAEPFVYEKTVTMEDFCFTGYDFQIGPDGNIYFVRQTAETCEAHGVILDPEGVLITEVGFGNGCDNGEFMDIFSLCVTTQEIYISEYGRGEPQCAADEYPERSTRIQAFRQSDKSYHFQYWEHFTDDYAPYMTVDETGARIYHLKGRSIIITGLSGSYIDEIVLATGNGDGEFPYDPDNGITFYENELYIPDYENLRIQVFDTDGVFVRQFPYGGTSLGFLRIYEDRIYIPDEDENKIYVYDTAGNFILSWGTAGMGDGEFNNPTYAFVGSSYLYVVDRGDESLGTNLRIQLFTIT